jgi:hypothetical protein
MNNLNYKGKAKYQDLYLGKLKINNNHLMKILLRGPYLKREREEDHSKTGKMN